MSKVSLKRWVFNLFLKWVTFETVRKSAVPCRWTREGEGALSEFGTQPRCDVASSSYLSQNADRNVSLWRW